MSSPTTSGDGWTAAKNAPEVSVEVEKYPEIVYF
jgi:hypothetical protein